MEKDDDGPLAVNLRRRMRAMKIGQKQLATLAGVNETYVRDILKGRSRNPTASKLRRVATVLECEASDLMDATVSAAEAGQFVRDPRELLLLETWRKLSQEEREGVLSYIAFRLSQAGASEAGTLGKTI
jgi:transcriptional regulator with XRE-family HTH domain